MGQTGSYSPREHVAHQRRNMKCLIAQILRIRHRPEDHQSFNDIGNRHALGNNQQSWTRFSRHQAIIKVAQREHRTTVVRYQDPAVGGNQLKEFRIANAMQLRFLRRQKIDGRFTPTHGFDDSKLQVVIGLEAKTQLRGSTACVLDRWIFSQSAGLATDIGTPQPSN